MTNFCPECGERGPLDSSFIEERCTKCGYTFKLEFWYMGRPGPIEVEHCGA